MTSIIWAVGSAAWLFAAVGAIQNNKALTRAIVYVWLSAAFLVAAAVGMFL